MAKPTEFYSTRGTFGNNTTIPQHEKERLAQLADGPDGARLRGEQSMDAFYKEFGVAPEGPYTDLENCLPTPLKRKKGK